MTEELFSFSSNQPQVSLKLVWFKTLVRYILLCYNTIWKKASHKYLYHLLSVYSEHNGSFQLIDRCVKLLGSSCQPSLQVTSVTLRNLSVNIFDLG